MLVDTATATLTNTHSYLATAARDVRATASADGQVAASDAALKSSLLLTTAIVEKAIATILGVFSAKSKDPTVTVSSGTSYVSSGTSGTSSTTTVPNVPVYNLVNRADGVYSAEAGGSLVFSRAVSKIMNDAYSAAIRDEVAIDDYVASKITDFDVTTVTDAALAKAVSSLASTLDNTKVNFSNYIVELETRLLADAVATLPKFVPNTAAIATFSQGLASYATFLNTLTSLQKLAYMKSNSAQYNLLVDLIKGGLDQAKASGVALTEADVRNLLTIINASGNGSDIALSAADFKVISDTKTAKAKAVADESKYNEIKIAVVDFLRSNGQTAAATDFSNIGLDEATVTTIRDYLKAVEKIIDIQVINPELVKTFNVANFVNEINAYYASPNEKISFVSSVITTTIDKYDMGIFILAKIISQISSLTAKDKSVERNTALGTQFAALTSAKKQDATDPLNALIDSVLGYMLG